MNRISQLPECLIHHILSFLSTSFNPPKELVRMSVLSKHWFHLTASYPTLIFQNCGFTSRREFYKYVDYATSRFCHHNVPAQRFTLLTVIGEAAEVDTINRCIELVSKNGVTELEINITYSTHMPEYRLPNILMSVSMLKSLSIRGCELPSVDVFKSKSLIRLKLDQIFIDDEAIKYLATSFPLLQVLEISSCHGFNSVCLYGNQNLQRVKIRETEVETIDIEAPNLSNLFIRDMDDSGPPRMHLALCKALTTVTYIGHLLPNSNDLTNFLSNFPFIENLVLDPGYSCHNLKLSSHSLRTLVLDSDCNLEDIEFSTPNLVLFIYASSDNWLCSPILVNKPWPLIRDSTHLKSCMHCYPGVWIDKYWFNKLRLFLDKKNGFKPMNLYIGAKYSKTFSDFKNLKEIELPPYKLEHVELHLDIPCDNAWAYKYYVGAVLCCCRPRSLTLRSFFPSSNFEKFVKFTYKKLLQQEDQSHTKIRIVSPSSSEAQKHFVGLKSLSMALPYDGNAICFIKEKVSREEAKSQRCDDMKIFRSLTR